MSSIQEDAQLQYNGIFFLDTQDVYISISYHILFSSLFPPRLLLFKPQNPQYICGCQFVDSLGSYCSWFVHRYNALFKHFWAIILHGSGYARSNTYHHVSVPFSFIHNYAHGLYSDARFIRLCCTSK